MSRLTLGGRKRAGGKIHEHRRQSEHEHENVDKQREDLQRTVDEDHDRSSYAPKYTYFKKILSCHESFLESENSLLLAVASVERNLAGKSFCMSIYKLTGGAWLRWEEVSRKLGDMLTV